MTINELEDKASKEFDYSWSIRIDGIWLECICYEANGDQPQYFKYVYGNKNVNRKAVMKLLGENENA